MPQFLMHFTDDTILVLPPNLVQFAHIKNLLMHFTAFTRLKFNYDKSILVPINVPGSQLPSLISILGCKKGSFPLTYLGLPLAPQDQKLKTLTKLRNGLKEGSLDAQHYFLMLAGFFSSNLSSLHLQFSS